MTTALAPPPPDSVRATWPAAIGGLLAYAELLAGPAVERGLLGPAEVPRLWERHLLNSAALADLLPTGARVADVGSGAGLPGIVLALVRPDLRLDLVDSLARRAAFLQEAVTALALPSTSVLHCRAEDVDQGGYDAVVARAVAPLDRLLAVTLPLLRPGGVLLALKGRRAATELEAAGPALRRYGGTAAQLVEVAVPGIASATPVDRTATVVSITRATTATARRSRPTRRASREDP